MQVNDSVPNEIGAADQPPDTTDAAADGRLTGEEIPSVEQALHQAQLKADEYHDAWLRAKAETENVRRRAQEDIAKAAKFAIDRFCAGVAGREGQPRSCSGRIETASVESLRSGTELTLRQLVAAFEKSALTEVNPLGEKFDPHRHQAISVVESEQEPNTVVTVLQKGYLLADRVLRPALVIVAKGSA
jgi:molecular chaperone GrpE